MRKWYAAAALAALLALPLFAQQKDEGTAKPIAETATAPEAPAAPLSVAPTAGGVFAVPAIPKATPFPGPQAAAKKDKETEPPGRLLPRYELAVGYSYINFDPGDPFGGFNNHGANGGFTYNATRVLGLTAELGQYHFQRDINGSSVKGGQTTFLFGPRLNLRRFDYFVPFAELLVGGARGGSAVTGDSGQSAFAMAAGGGVDIVLTKNIAWRFAQIDYLMENFSGSALNAKDRQNNLRLGSGLVIRLGIPNPPPPRFERSYCDSRYCQRPGQ